MDRLETQATLDTRQRTKTSKQNSGGKSAQVDNCLFISVLTLEIHTIIKQMRGFGSPHSV
jgi:hypothetical protein